MLECSGKRYTAAQLRAVFPLPEKAQTNSSQDNCDGVGDWYDAAKKLPDNLRALIKDGPQQPDADRSKVFHSVVGQLKRLGWSADNIFQLLNKFPSGIALKYASTGRLQKNVGSSFGKCDAPPPGLPDHDTCCPAHDDGTPSLSIRDARGKVVGEQPELGALGDVGPEDVSGRDLGDRTSCGNELRLSSLAGARRPHEDEAH